MRTHVRSVLAILLVLLLYLQRLVIRKIDITLQIFDAQAPSFAVSCFFHFVLH